MRPLGREKSLSGLAVTREMSQSLSKCQEIVKRLNFMMKTTTIKVMKITLHPTRQ